MPDLYIIGGPNGAGKTTIAMQLLPALNCREYVNADLIAAGLSPFAPETTAIQAGRLMLQRIHALAGAKANFAFETTLASRTLVPFLTRCRDTGYTITVIYVWLFSADLAVQRVAQRVRNGGHAVPEETVRRRYEGGRRNLLSAYLPSADFWKVYDNSSDSPLLIAERSQEEITVHDPGRWNSITQMG